MKKLLILLVSIPLLLSSCLKDQNDLFSEDSSTRVDNVQKEVNAILKEAANGWQMEYYPSSLKQYGGYVMFARFKDGNKVDFSSEIFAPSDVAESLYAFGADTGPTLNFDTFNEIFHFWSTPDPDGKGWEGDYEFVIIKYTKEMITLKGKKTGNYCILTPLAADKTWEEALTEYTKAVASMDDAASYAVGLPGSETLLPLTKSYRSYSLNISRGGTLKTSKAAFIYTQTGIKFDSPFEVADGVFINTMTYDPATAIFTDDAGSGITIEKVITPLNEIITVGKWYFKYSTLSPWAKGMWTVTKNGVIAAGEQLYRVYLGTQNSPFGLCFQSLAGTSLYGGTFNYTAVPVAGTRDQVVMTCLMTATGDGGWYHSNAKLANLLNIIAYGGTVRKFNLTADNPNNPSWIKFTEIAPTTGTANENHFTVTKQEVVLPSDK